MQPDAILPPSRGSFTIVAVEVQAEGQGAAELVAGVLRAVLEPDGIFPPRPPGLERNHSDPFDTDPVLQGQDFHRRPRR